MNNIVYIILAIIILLSLTIYYFYTHEYFSGNISQIIPKVKLFVKQKMQ